MTLSEALRWGIIVIQSVSLICVIGICICRINAMHLTTSNAVRFSYIFLAAGALGVLLKAEYHWEVCGIALGIAMCLYTERRGSICYLTSKLKQPKPTSPMESV
jgi:hypothetical protein